MEARTAGGTAVWSGLIIIAKLKHLKNDWPILTKRWQKSSNNSTAIIFCTRNEICFCFQFKMKKKKWKHKVGKRSMNQLYAEHRNVFFSLFSRGNRFWFEWARDSSKWGFKLSGVNCNNTREYFFMSVWLHNDFILCQNKIFCIDQWCKNAA